MEQPPAPAAAAAAAISHGQQRAPPRLSQRQLPVADSTEGEMLREMRSPRLLSLGDRGSADGGKVARLALGETQEELDEGVAGLTSPTEEAPPLQAPFLPPGKGERGRSCTRSASKKRREFGGGRGAVAALTSDTEPLPPPSSSQQLLHRYHAVHTRDYSVDEKSDALFREFSRCEPVPGDSLRPRLSAAAHRRHQHHRHAHLSASSYPYARKVAAAAAGASLAAAAAAVPSPAQAVVVADKALVVPPGPGLSISPSAAAAAATNTSSVLPVIRVALDDVPERLF